MNDITERINSIMSATYHGDSLLSWQKEFIKSIEENTEVAIEDDILLSKLSVYANRGKHLDYPTLESLLSNQPIDRNALVLPLEIQLEEGYPLQLSVDKSKYMHGLELVYLVEDVREGLTGLEGYDNFLFHPDSVYRFKITIPYPPKEEFLIKRIPGQFYHEQYETIYLLNEDRQTYSTYNHDKKYTLDQVTQGLVEGTLSDNTPFTVLTWVI